MARRTKVIITCAVTGAIHTPSMSGYLPVTADEIVDQALGAAAAGASVLHLHARNPETGQPDQTPETFKPFLPRIKPSRRGWSRWRENLAGGCGLSAGRGSLPLCGGCGCGAWGCGGRMGAGCP